MMSRRRKIVNNSGFILDSKIFFERERKVYFHDFDSYFLLKERERERAFLGVWLGLSHFSERGREVVLYRDR